MPRPIGPPFPSPLFKLGLILLACSGVYLIGNESVPLWDRDEPRFAQTSRQMLQSGDWVVPHLYDAVRTAKPPLIYWVQATCMKVLGDQGSAGVFAARLPSAVAMMLTLLVVAAALWRQVGPDHAVWSVLILSTCALVMMAAKSGLTDSVLLLFVTIAQLCLYAIWRGQATWGVTVVMAMAIALALLTKGPVAVGVQLMTLLALGVLRLTLRGEEDDATRMPAPVTVPELTAIATTTTPMSDGTALDYQPRVQKRDHGWTVLRGATKILLALTIVLAVGLPWARLVEQRHPGFLRTAFNHEIKDRAASGLEGHKGPPGYYLVSIWPTFLPWSLVLPLALVMGWKRRRDPRVRFALAAVAGPWLMFEVVQTKLPHYLLPCFPPLAFLTANAILECLRRQALNRIPLASVLESARSGATLNYQSPVHNAPAIDPLNNAAFNNAVLAWTAIALLLGLVPWLATIWFAPLPWAVTLLVSIVAGVYALTVCRLFRSGRPDRALAAMGVGMLGLTAALFGLYLPRAPFLRLSLDTARVLRDQRSGPGQVIMLDYKEPSLAFYQGGTIREDTSLVATDRLLANSPPWLVITDRVYEAEGTDRRHLEVLARFKGLDVSSSLRVVEVLVVKKRRNP